MSSLLFYNMLRTNVTFSIDNKYTAFSTFYESIIVVIKNEQDQFQTFIGKGVSNVIIFVVDLKILSLQQAKRF